MRSRIIGPRESLVLYKSFNMLCLILLNPTFSYIVADWLCTAYILNITDINYIYII